MKVANGRAEDPDGMCSLCLYISPLTSLIWSMPIDVWVYTMWWRHVYVTMKPIPTRWRWIDTTELIPMI